MRPTVPQKEAGVGCRLRQLLIGSQVALRDGAERLLDLLSVTSFLILDTGVLSGEDESA